MKYYDDKYGYIYRSYREEDEVKYKRAINRLNKIELLELIEYLDNYDLGLKPDRWNEIEIITLN